MNLPEKPEKEESEQSFRLDRRDFLFSTIALGAAVAKPSKAPAAKAIEALGNDSPAAAVSHAKIGSPRRIAANPSDPAVALAAPGARVRALPLTPEKFLRSRNSRALSRGGSDIGF